MKKSISLLLTVLMLLSLSACGGSESSEPVNADKPLESAAPTEAPQCSHSFGPWQTGGESQMLRACTLCGETETAALDREAMFRELIIGNWDQHSTSGLYGDSDTYTAMPYISRQLIIITEPDRAEYKALGIESGVELAYTGYEKQDSSDVYKLRCEYDDGSGGMDATLVHSDEGDFLSLIMGGLGSATFCRNDEREQFIPGRYVCGEHYIELHADRSVTGNIGGEVKGYWVLKPVISTEAGLIFGINVNAQQGSPDDSDYTVFISQDTFLVGQSIEELENFSHDKISISFFEKGYTFLPEGTA